MPINNKTVLIMSTYKKPAHEAPKPVRRHKNSEGWCIADPYRNYFDGGFQSGIMFDVTFVPNARPMTCVSGYESTGEAIGVILEVDDPTMPSDAVRSVEIIYDSKDREFRAKDGPGDETITNPDYLVLSAEGTAIAGWR